MGKELDVLIVEDETDIRDAISELLSTEGIATATAANGEEALAQLSHLPRPKLILLDLLMPIMNGLEFREKQRQIPGIAEIPVVIMSADNSTKATAEKMHLGYLRKPVDLENLITTVKQYCA